MSFNLGGRLFRLGLGKPSIGDDDLGFLIKEMAKEEYGPYLFNLLQYSSKLDKNSGQAESLKTKATAIYAVIGIKSDDGKTWVANDNGAIYKQIIDRTKAYLAQLDQIPYMTQAQKLDRVSGFIHNELTREMDIVNTQHPDTVDFSVFKTDSKLDKSNRATVHKAEAEML